MASYSTARDSYHCESVIPKGNRVLVTINIGFGGACFEICSPLPLQYILFFCILLDYVTGDSESKRPGEGVGNYQFRLVFASISCACLSYRGRGSTQKCPYEPIRNERELWIRQNSLQDVTPRNANNNAAFQRYEAELKTILDVNSTTVILDNDDELGDEESKRK
jgi:hypothetical protein